MENKKVCWKLSVLIIAFVGMFIFFFTKPVIVQNPDYHQFIDQRTFLGIPNAFDVLTNVFFLLAGFFGIVEVLRKSGLLTKKSWFWFFISIVLVAPGSAYYHWSPDNSTLIWDRLPMSMGFMALYIILLAEHINLKLQSFLVPALLVGISSVLVWALSSDLRFYFWIQFSSFITIPVILILFPSRFTHKHWYFVSLSFYGLAKWTEIKDKEIFFGTGEVISGHSLKHLLAAAGLLGLWWMIRVRKESVTGANGCVTNSTL